jgi:hypothetical protein
MTQPLSGRFALRDAVNYLHKENRTFEAAKMLARWLNHHGLVVTGTMEWIMTFPY